VLSPIFGMILLSFEVRATEGCPSALGNDPDKELNLIKKNIQITKEKKEELLSSKDYNNFYLQNFNFKNYFDQFIPNNDEVLKGKKIKPDYLFDWFIKDIGPNTTGVKKLKNH
jgi:hypothetical protein